MESDELSGDSYGCADDLVLPGSRKGNVDGAGENGDDGKRKRRFSDEQIKSLECTFEAQTKLEPRKKLQLARELGLQPRQVAIWFQNKRARWKSKQLERDYSALRAEYDALLSSFDSLEKEKQSLAKQLQMLEELIKKPSGVSSGSDGGDSDQSNAKGEEETKPILASVARSDLTLNTVCFSKEEFIRHEEKLRIMPDLSAAASDPVIDGPLCFDAGSFSDRSCGSSSDWWEFWPLNE